MTGLLECRPKPGLSHMTCHIAVSPQSSPSCHAPVCCILYIPVYIYLYMCMWPFSPVPDFVTVVVGRSPRLRIPFPSLPCQPPRPLNLSMGRGQQQAHFHNIHIYMYTQITKSFLRKNSILKNNILLKILNKM